MQANAVFVHTESFRTLGFKLKLLVRTEKMEIYSTCKYIRGHMVRRGPRYLRIYRSVQRTEAAIERLSFHFSTFIYLLLSVLSKNVPLNNILASFSTFVLCILILSKSFIYQLMHNRAALK